MSFHFLGRGRHGGESCQRTAGRSEGVPAVARFFVRSPILEVGVRELVNGLEAQAVDMLVEIVLTPVVALDSDGQHLGGLVVALLDGGCASVGRVFQFALVISRARQFVEILASHEDILSVILQRSQLGVVDEFYAVHVQRVVGGTARHGVRGERSQHVLFCRSLHARVFERCCEARPFCGVRYHDGGQRHFVAFITFFVGRFGVAISVVIVNDELAAAVLATAADELGVANYRVRRTGKEHAVGGVRPVCEVVVGGLGRSHAAHVDAARGQVAVGIGNPQVLGREFYGCLAVVSFHFLGRWRHGSKGCKSTAGRSKGVPTVARFFVRSPILEVGVRELVNAFETHGVDVLVEVLLAPVVALDGDGQHAAVLIIVFFDGGCAAIGCAFQFALVVGYAWQVVQRLALNEEVLAVVL